MALTWLSWTVPIASWLLLIGGLAHLIPEKFRKLLEFKLGPVTLQQVVGILSVLAALYVLFM
jgi:hypothetical protein